MTLSDPKAMGRLGRYQAIRHTMLTDPEAAQEMIKNLEKQLSEAQDEAGTLLQQVMELGEESGLAGDTPEETAVNIVEQYHQTHTYSMTDLFVCADMAMDVWNMNLETH